MSANAAYQINFVEPIESPGDFVSLNYKNLCWTV